MSVSHCHVCDKNPDEARRINGAGLSDGVVCPVCHRPACRFHLVTVRWRWRTPTRDLDSAQICRECNKAYRHRDWDTLHREWIN